MADHTQADRERVHELGRACFKDAQCSFWSMGECVCVEVIAGALARERRSCQAG